MSTMITSQTVYYGPNNSTYLSNGSVFAGQTVTAVWREGSWVHIEFTSGGQIKRGFVPSTSITVTETIGSIINENLVRYIIDTASSYDGPGTTYAENQPLPKGKKVRYIGQRPNYYACIEYSIGASDDLKKIRAYVTTSKLSDSFTISGYQTFTEGQTIPSGYHYSGATVSQGFNDMNTTHRGHLGYDLTGFSNVTAILAGTVVGVVNSIAGANGRVVCVQHTLNGTTFYSVYCHLSSICVAVNDSVAKGTQLGVMGGSGNGSESAYATHLHLATFTGGSTTDPYGYCYSGGSKRFEEIATNYANPYYYGPNTAQFPRCGSRKFYDPYGVITSNGAVFAKV